MRKALSFLILIVMLLGATAFGVSAALARGGHSADDCTPDSTDPDCK